MEFWIITTAIAALVAGFLVFSLRAVKPASDMDDVELQFYKSQLAEIARDVERGIILKDEAERLRTEISRRILKLDERRPTLTVSKTSNWNVVVPVVIVASIIGGSGGLYSYLGSPGYRDLSQKDRIALAETSRKTRPSLNKFLTSLPTPPKNEPNETYSKLVIKLRETVKTRPQDLEGHLLLTRVETGLQNFLAASIALDKAIQIKGNSANAEDFFDYAELLILAAQGYVSPEAENALNQVLKRNIKFSGAHYYVGLMMAQNDRPDRAFQVWRKLLLQTPEDSPWIEPIRAQIEDVAIAAGVNDFELPKLVKTAPVAPISGPGPEDLKAAKDLSNSERMDMIQGMVQRLSERLATQGGTSQEWAQLIRALIVLEDEDQATAVWEDAKSVFAQYPDDLAIIESVAKETGVIK